MGEDVISVPNFLMQTADPLKKQTPQNESSTNAIAWTDFCRGTQVLSLNESKGRSQSAKGRQPKRNAACGA